MEFKDRDEEQKYWRKRDEEYEKAQGLELEYPDGFESTGANALELRNLFRALYKSKNIEIKNVARVEDIKITSFELKQFFLNNNGDPEYLMDNFGGLDGSFHYHRIDIYHGNIKVPAFRISCLDGRSEEEKNKESEAKWNKKNTNFTIFVFIVNVAACVGATYMFDWNPKDSIWYYVGITAFVWFPYWVMRVNEEN